MEKQLEEINQKLFLLKKRIREPEMNELFEKHNRSIIEVINRTSNNHLIISNDGRNSNAHNSHSLQNIEEFRNKINNDMPINKSHKDQNNVNDHLPFAQQEETMRSVPNKNITTNANRNANVIPDSSHCLNNESTSDIMIQNSSIRVSKKSTEGKSKKIKKSPPKATVGSQKVVNLPPEDNLINIAFGKNGAVQKKIPLPYSQSVPAVKKKEEETKQNVEKINEPPKEKPVPVDIPKQIIKEEPMTTLLQPVQVNNDKTDHFFDQKEDIFETDLDREIIYPTPPFEDDDMKNEIPAPKTNKDPIPAIPTKPELPTPNEPLQIHLTNPPVESIKPEKEQSPQTQVTVLKTKISIPNTFITNNIAVSNRKNTNEKKVSKIVNDDEGEEYLPPNNSSQINEVPTAKINDNSVTSLNESVSMIGNRIKIPIDFKGFSSPIISEKSKNDIAKASIATIVVNNNKQPELKSDKDKHSANNISSLNVIEIDRKRLSLMKPIPKFGNESKEKKEIENAVSKKIISSIKEIANRPKGVDKKEKKSENPMVKLLESSGEIKKKDFSSYFIFSLKEEISNIYKKISEHIQNKSNDNNSQEVTNKLHQFEVEWESIESACNQINEELSTKEFKFQTICEKSLKITAKIFSILSHPDNEKLYEVIFSMVELICNNFQLRF